MHHVPVLVVGGGTVGLATALFLAHHGTPALVVEARAGLSTHPRATGVGPRTVELFREVGLADDLDRAAIDMRTAGLGKISATTLAEADLPALAATAPPFRSPAAPQVALVSPTILRGTCPQDRLDRVLYEAGQQRGVNVQFDTRLTGLTQDPSGVTATVDGPAGRQTLRADYLVAADGTGSTVRDLLGIPTEGPGVLGDPHLNIYFEADLSELTADHTFVACDITSPDAPGILVTIDADRHWVFHHPFHPERGESAADLTPDRCRDLVRRALGAPEADVRIVSALPWQVRAQVADRFRDGRVFLVGDAAHAIPPLGAFGMNTGVADAHNLAWKLAHVLAGTAGPALLDSYDEERRPVATMTMRQAVLRLGNPGLHWGAGPEIIAERARVGALNAPVVHLGYRYASRAIIDPQPELPSTEDVRLDLDGSPGSRVPHIWVQRGGNRLSTLDLVGSRFTLLTGPKGDDWRPVASTAADRFGVKLPVHVVGPAADPDGSWAEAAGIDNGGALLVRPDGFVAWRAPTFAEAGKLPYVLGRILSRKESAA